MTRNNPITCITVMWIALAPVWASGATLNVPGGFVTIQECIDAAQDGDECVVAPDTYHELIDFMGKAITLRSSGGPTVTIIDAGPVADPGTGKPVVRCDTGEGPDTVLDGFTITGGTGDNSAFPGSHAGGGMFNLTSSPTVNNCVFIHNTADGGSGMYNSGLGNDEGSNPIVSNCIFSENEASVVGGGMFNRDSNPTVTDCVFINNVAIFAGGGMYNLLNNSMVNNCTFSGNSVGDGVGGGMYNLTSGLSVNDCTFTGNIARGGGGMYNIQSSAPIVTNCTFITNLNVGIANFENSNATVTNSVLWGNGSVEIFNHNSTLLISFSDIQGSGGSINWDAMLGTDSGGNIDADPMFVDIDGADNIIGTVDDNLRLLAGSPCINTGDPGFIARPTATDLEGHARVLCMRVDIGAYEFGIGDFNCDQIVTLTDFADWTSCMVGPDANSISPACEAFDFNFDVDVDLQDWAGFQHTLTVP